MSQGELSKVTIRAFKNKKLTQKVPKPNDEFVIPVNPESYTENYTVEYDPKKGQGNKGTNPRYKGHKPGERKLEFTFDGTDTIEGYVYNNGKYTVREQIDQFMKVVYDMNGDLHQPNYLKLCWGSQHTFDCVLTSLDINYTYFHPNGEPLRAKISATFLNYKEQDRRAKEEKKKSPDLTHVRKVKAKETLPYLSYDIYGNANYFLQVASFNELTSFRNLQTDKDLVFPPVERANK